MRSYWIASIASCKSASISAACSRKFKGGSAKSSDSSDTCFINAFFNFSVSAGVTPTFAVGIVAADDDDAPDVDGAAQSFPGFVYPVEENLVA